MEPSSSLNPARLNPIPEGPGKSYLKIASEKIVYMAKTVANCVASIFISLGHFFKRLVSGSSNSEVKEKFSQILKKHIEKEEKKVEPTPVQQSFSAPSEKLESIPEEPTMPQDEIKEKNPLIKKSIEIEGKTTSHAKGRQLVADIVDEFTESVMNENVRPAIPQAMQHAQKTKEHIASFSNLLSEITNKFNQAVSPSIPSKLMESEKSEPFTLLFDLMDMVILSKYIATKENIDPRALILKAVYGENPDPAALEWLPSEFHPYLDAAVDWVATSYETKKTIPFEKFIKESDKNYGFDKNNFDKEKFTELLVLVARKVFDPLQIFLGENNRALSELLQPDQMENTVHELIHENFHLAGGLVTDRLFELLGKIEFVQLLKHILPSVQNQIEDKLLPLNPEQEESFARVQGDAVIDLVFPIVEDEKGKQVRTLSLLWDKVHIPKKIDAILQSLPSMDTAVQKMAGLQGNENLPPQITHILSNVRKRTQERAVLAVQTKLNEFAADIVKQMVDKVSDPEFVNSLISESVLPNSLDKIVSKFTEQVFVRNINDDFATLFHITIIGDENEKAAARNQIKDELLKLMMNPGSGFSNFKPYDESDLKAKAEFEAKFNELVDPMIQRVQSHLQKVRSEKGDFTNKEVVEEIKNAFKYAPQSQISDEVREQFANIISSAMQEGEVLNDSWLKTIYNYMPGFITQSNLAKKSENWVNNSLSELIITSLPSTEDLLVITMDSLRRLWTTESEENGQIVKRIDLDKVMARKGEKPDPEQVGKDLDQRLAALSALSSDLVSQVAYHNVVEPTRFKFIASNLIYGATKAIAGPSALQAPIEKIYLKVFGNKEKNKQLFYPILEKVIGQLGTAHKELTAEKLKGRVSVVL